MGNVVEPLTAASLSNSSAEGPLSDRRHNQEGRCHVFSSVIEETVKVVKGSLVSIFAGEPKLVAAAVKGITVIQRKRMQGAAYAPDRNTERPTAREALRRIAEFYHVEDKIRSQSAYTRRTLRKANS
ncbi:hypothetical protein [Mesorhizobium sp. LjNodule214]|uniref:hypothetical protein n=1 Tax=Mesorhizobium sp. LjNodule214 TaxID=3342252 RepID=UPI003ED02940